MENKEKTFEQDEWKLKLRSELITGIIGNEEEKANAYGEVGYYYTCCAPASIYKYYSDNELNMDSLKNNKMWYSAPCNFNDVFDCDIFINEEKIFNDFLKLIPDKRTVRVGSKIWIELKSIIRKEIKKLRYDFDASKYKIGVSCFSESEDSLLMWAHYANNHRGMCVEYNLLDINSVLDFSAIPVIYSENQACFDFFDEESIEKDTSKLFIESLSSKSPEWSYEKEWRIIRDQEACGDKWNSDKKGALLDMISPRSVILGCVAEAEFAKEVKDYCSINKINLYKMEKDSSQYKLNKKVILDFNEDV